MKFFSLLTFFARSLFVSLFPLLIENGEMLFRKFCIEEDYKSQKFLSSCNRFYWICHQVVSRYFNRRFSRQQSRCTRSKLEQKFLEILSEIFFVVTNFFLEASIFDLLAKVYAILYTRRSKWPACCMLGFLVITTLYALKVGTKIFGNFIKNIFYYDEFFPGGLHFRFIAKNAQFYRLIDQNSRHFIYSILEYMTLNLPLDVSFTKKRYFRGPAVGLWWERGCEMVSRWYPESTIYAKSTKKMKYTLLRAIFLISTHYPALRPSFK